MLPPPALTVSIRTAGSASGTPPTMVVPSRLAAPRLDQTRVGARAAHVERQEVAATQGLAEQLRTDHSADRAGRAPAEAAASAAASAEMVPPPDAMRRNVRTPRRAAPAAARVTDAAHQRAAGRPLPWWSRTARTLGTAAATSWLATTGTPGNAARSAAASRRSCSGWRKANSSATATASGRRSVDRGGHASHFGVRERRHRRRRAPSARPRRRRRRDATSGGG